MSLTVYASASVGNVRGFRFDLFKSEGVEVSS